MENRNKSNSPVSQESTSLQTEEIKSNKTSWKGNKGGWNGRNNGTRGHQPRQFKGSPWGEEKFSNLNKITSLNWQLNPDEYAIKAPSYYKIVNGTNKITTANFQGDVNEAGNVLSRLLTLNKSSFNSYFDSVAVPMALNYMFLNYESSGLTAANITFKQAVEEALANTHSTILTELLFSRSEGTSSILGITDSRVGALIHYQTTLQNIALVLTKYNQTMGLTDEMIKMGFNAESTITSELLSLFKKSAFVARLKSISKYILSKYFDHDWYSQFVPLTDTPSRKCDSVREPVITAMAYYTMPSAKLTASGVSWYDSSTQVATVKTTDPFTQSSITYTNYSVSDFSKLLVGVLDQNTMLKWARRKFNNSTSVGSPQSYFNYVNDLLSGLAAAVDKFVAQATDIEVFLDRAASAGLTNWKKGSVFNPDLNSKDLYFNTIIHDMLSAYLTSPDKISWNPATQKWSFSVLWNEFFGVPKYDQYTGGSYITFSVRNAILPNGFDPADPALLTPKLFNINNSPVACNRSGSEISVRYDIMNANEIINDNQLSRIIPYDDMTDPIFAIRIANLTVTRVVSARPISTAQYLMQTLAGFGKVTWTEGKTVKTIASLSGSILSVLDGQVDCLGSDMINYLRSNSPLRVWIGKDKNIGMIIND